MDGVGIKTTVEVTLCEAMNQAATQGAFSMRQTVSSADVLGTFMWDGTAKMLTFTPDAALTKSTSHTVTIGTGATDLAGNPLATAYNFSFTTVGVTDDDDACGCTPQQTDTTALATIFGTILSCLPLLLLLFLINTRFRMRMLT